MPVFGVVAAKYDAEVFGGGAEGACDTEGGRFDADLSSSDGAVCVAMVTKKWSAKAEWDPSLSP